MYTDEIEEILRHQIVQKLSNLGYTELSLLGEGSYGCVYRATNKQKRQIAVKALKISSGQASQKTIRDFLSEYKIASKLKTRSAIKPQNLQIDEANNLIFYEMEYCPLGSLTNWQGKKNDPLEVLSAILHVADALEELHSTGGFHRDIKPGNILAKDEYNTSSQNNVRVFLLADFGLAKSPDLDSATMTERPRGTRAYKAPEIIAGKDYTSAADIYSLGLTMLELLTGSREITSASTLEGKYKNLIMDMTHSQPIKRISATNIKTRITSILDNTYSEGLSSGEKLLLAAIAGIVTYGLYRVITSPTKPKQLENTIPEYYTITSSLMRQLEKDLFIQYLEDHSIPHQWTINRKYQDGGHTTNRITYRDGLVIVSSREEAQGIINGFLQNSQNLYLQKYLDIAPLVLDNFLDEELRERQAVVTIEPQIST